MNTASLANHFFKRGCRSGLIDRFGRSTLFKYDKEANKYICTINSVVNENLNDEFHRYLEHHNGFDNHAYNMEFMFERIDLLVNLKD